MKFLYFIVTGGKEVSFTILMNGFMYMICAIKMEDIYGCRCG